MESDMTRDEWTSFDRKSWDCSCSISIYVEIDLKKIKIATEVENIKIFIFLADSISFKQLNPNSYLLLI